MNTQQILTAAADYLDRPDVYLYKQTGVIDDDGNVLLYTKEFACALSAIMEVSDKAYRPAKDALLDFLGEKDLPEWNDRPERRKAEVVLALRGAAAAEGSRIRGR